MPRVHRCSFCGKVIPPGTGMMYVRNDGTVLYFCSRKCKRSYFMRRNPKRYKWARH